MTEKRKLNLVHVDKENMGLYDKEFTVNFHTNEDPKEKGYVFLGISKKYPDGIYLYNIKNSEKDFSITELKAIVSEIINLMKEQNITKLYFHPANRKILRIISKMKIPVQQKSFWKDPLSSIRYGAKLTVIEIDELKKLVSNL